MSEVVRVKRQPFPVPGMHDGTYHTLSINKLALVLRESPTTSVMTVDRHDLAAYLDPRPAKALLNRAAVITRSTTKRGLRIVVSQRDGELIEVLKGLGFAETAPIEPEHLEFTKKFL